MLLSFGPVLLAARVGMPGNEDMVWADAVAAAGVVLVIQPLWMKSLVKRVVAGLIQN